MTQKQLERYLGGLWERHARPDRHGYKDFMHPGGFAGAVREALQDFGVEMKEAKIGASHNTAKVRR